MKKLLLSVWALSTILTLGLNAYAGSSDSGFLRKFNNYQSKHSVSTFRAAKAFASHLKMKPEQILKRYISAAFEVGGPTKDTAVKNGIDAFRESGLTYENALVQVSDTVGQMTDTLEAIYKRNSMTPGRPVVTNRAPMAPSRGLASVRSK